MKHSTAAVYLAIFALGCASISLPADSQAAQPAKSSATQPSRQSAPRLAETMTFIQDKLVANSSIGYVASVQSSKDKSTVSTAYNVVFSDIKASAPKCSITVHKKITRDGAVIADVDASTLLKDVHSVTIRPLPAAMTADSAKAGHPELTTLTTAPKIYLLNLNRYDSGQISFYFTDFSLAYRMKRATAHAVELCGGGKKEPF